MHPRILIVAALIFSGGIVQAQSQPGGGATLIEAAAFRAGLVAEIQRGETVKQALEEISKHPAPCGLEVDGNTGLALAAMDIGQRLLVVRRAETAEAFFRVAEQALNDAIAARGKDEAGMKANLLQKRALIRNRYLGKLLEARADLEEALRLQPESRELKRSFDLLRSEKAEIFNQPLSKN